MRVGGEDGSGAVDAALSYTVPVGVVTQTVYFRGGNTTDELVYVVLTRDGTPMRYFPIGAKSSEHVTLAVTEDIFPETKLDVLLAAPAGRERARIICASRAATCHAFAVADHSGFSSSRCWSPALLSQTSRDRQPPPAYKRLQRPSLRWALGSTPI